MILCVEGNKAVGNPLPKVVKNTEGWVQEEVGQVDGRNLLKG